MNPPKCPHCGKAEWRHLCGGASQSEIGRRYEKARGSSKLPAFVTRDVPRSEPASRVKAMQREIDALHGEVAQLKKRLAEANAQLANIANKDANAPANTVSVPANAANKPKAKTDRKEYMRELMRKKRAKPKTTEHQFEG